MLYRLIYETELLKNWKENVYHFQNINNRNNKNINYKNKKSIKRQEHEKKTEELKIKRRP